MIQTQQGELQGVRGWSWSPPTVLNGWGQRLFWPLLTSQLVLVLVVFVWALQATLPATRAPLAASDERRQVVDAVYARIDGSVADRLLPTAAGLSRESSLRGFLVNNHTYYYQLAGSRNADPLSLGCVAQGQVEVVFHDQRAPQPLLIYTLLR